MKNKLQLITASIAMTFAANGQITGTAAITGTSSSQSPYLMPLISNATITSILTTSDVVNGYTMCGVPDGIGAYDNGNGSFTVLMNHELTGASGAVRSHGSTGAFISKFTINKSNLAVISGSDLIQNVNLWTGTNYTLYNMGNPSPAASFTRFCSADLPPVAAFYHVATGLGTQSRIFMNGEETGAEGRAFAHIATGPAAGNTYQLPYLGRASWENLVASPFTGTKTVLGMMDDSSPGQVYFYIGTKTNSGIDIDKAGLTNGNVYGVAVTGLAAESNTNFPNVTTTFSLINLGNVSAITGASLDALSTSSGVTTFLRPEDGAWDPSTPTDFYFNTTNSFGSPSRLYRLRFNNISAPELGGTILAVLDGTEGQQMFDNIGISNNKNAVLLEDVGNNAHNGKMWNYNLTTDVSTVIAQHDPSRFITGGMNFLTQDEETSGVIDMESILGTGYFLFVDQAHFGLPSPMVEGGQLLLIFNPLAAPEINITGNANDIPDGSVVTTTTNNTDFGTVSISQSVSKTFVIQNSGYTNLILNNYSIVTPNISEFTIINAPTGVILPGASTSLTILFTPSNAGLRTATITLNNNDVTEPSYDFVISGNGTVVSTGVAEKSNEISDFQIQPNPATEELTVVFNTSQQGPVTIELLDITGSIVLDTKVINNLPVDQKIKFDTSTVFDGCYFVRIADGNNIKTKKIIISH